MKLIVLTTLFLSFALQLSHSADLLLTGPASSVEGLNSTVKEDKESPANISTNNATQPITAPDPPSNLSIDTIEGKVANLRWQPPASGGFSGFKLKVFPLSELTKSIRTIFIKEDSSPFPLKDLTPGATYEIQLFTVYENKESAAYISTNFTTKPNTPGRFIVWFRNETTLLVLWQPPYPAGVYTDYKVSIDPPDAELSETYVAKEGEPPGPAQAAFNALIPGRAYNISVETVSENEISDPTTAQYRTVPWRPHNVSFDMNQIGPDYFEVSWSGPRELTEFDRYQVAIGIRRKTPQIIERGAPLKARFTENLKPGRTYQVVVKTVSGSVVSWPATGNVTTRPLPVLDNIQTQQDRNTKETIIYWEPHPDSNQDKYKITYHELENTVNGDSGSVYVRDTTFSLLSLQPGRNYSISISAVAGSPDVSQEVESENRTIYHFPGNVITRPLPVLDNIQTLIDEDTKEAMISWEPNPDSNQDKYKITYYELENNFNGNSGTVYVQDTFFFLENLQPGRNYSISISAVSNANVSQELESDKRTVYHATHKLRNPKVTNFLEQN